MGTLRPTSPSSVKDLRRVVVRSRLILSSGETLHDKSEVWESRTVEVLWYSVGRPVLITKIKKGQ